ncbi:MAG: NADPH-dependent assimilatory sulfite reductase hemoprotein subunit [Candidatus Sumerlaeia bacterium]|nr:NADPH-dependent assimilatory sulfite reductase hemoprotein subunit [Candidatus Sumerlaeia bacterium]
MSDAGTGNDAPNLSKVEHLKIASQGLYGTLQESLESDSDHFSEDEIQLLKHHGSYQQDDRDARRERRKAGLDKDYKLMVRTKTPGGRMTAAQYLLCDDLSDTYGQGDLRITSRQGFQFHGVLKKNIRALIHDLNHLQHLTTQGACGDVVRNVMCSPVVDIDPTSANCGVDLLALAERISTHFLAQSGSYYDIWLDDEKVDIAPDGSIRYKQKGPSKPVEEPIYGKQYLPRKFKIGIALDSDNSIDVYTQDVGIVALTEGGRVTAYEVLVGGGLGYGHGKAETYPRLGTPLTCVGEKDLLAVVEGIVKTQRDLGNREQRHQARLKYTVDRLGIDAIRASVAKHAGIALPPPSGRRPLDQPDHLGWHKQAQPGLNYVGAWVENGRIRDFEGGARFRTGLRRIVETYRPSIRLTGHHNIILADIADEHVAAVQALLDEHGIPTDRTIEPIRRHEMACPALPLCGLALAEAEREMPRLMERLVALGHAEDDVVIRMTGCPNSCARPETSEIGIVGRGPGKYNLYVGGDRLGARMNSLLAENVEGDRMPETIAALLAAWRRERAAGQSFGDWADARGMDALKPILP